MEQQSVVLAPKRRLSLDTAVKWAIICLCIPLTLDVGIRALRPLWAGAPRVSPEQSNGPIPPPEASLPVEPLSLDDVALRGDSKAPVAIIAYSDFQCPYCRVFAQSVWPELQRTLIDTGQAQFAFRHLPLDSIHPQARRLGVLSECVRQLGRFWEFHDVVFERQRELTSLDSDELLAAIGVQPTAVQTCAEGSQAIEAVNRDSKEAKRLGVRGTPTFFVGRIQSDGRVRVTQRLAGAQAALTFRAAVEAATTTLK